MYIVIAGGGKIGSYLAGIMLKSGNEVAVIEQRLATADRLSVQLTGPYLVIHGDGCDSRYQEDAGIRQADVFVATTGQDDSNLVSCEIAQRVFRVPRCIARVNNPKNERIFREVGIECVSSTTLIANLIEEEALLGSVSVVSSLTHGNVALAEVMVPRMVGGTMILWSTTRTACSSTRCCCRTTPSSRPWLAEGTWKWPTTRRCCIREIRPS